jgi:hypothetical protein
MMKNRQKWLKAEGILCASMLLTTLLATALPCHAQKGSPVPAPAPEQAFQTARLPVLIFEPGSPIRMRFAPSPHDLLNDRETLVTIVANCVVVSQTREELTIQPTYEDGSNHGYIWFYARSGEDERLLGIIHFASQTLPVDSEDDLVLLPNTVRNLVEMEDENRQTVAYVGFFVGGPMKECAWILFGGDFQTSAPDRERRLPKWAEAELRFPPGKVGSRIPPSALPKRPSNCDGFGTDGRKSIEGEWIDINSRPRGSGYVCGRIGRERGSTYSFRLCGKAALDFVVKLGINLPGPGRVIDVGGNIKIRGEINGCITVTITNNTNTEVNIMCQDYTANQIMIRDVFCCVNNTVRLCERWVCARTVVITETSIPALGIKIPPTEPTIPPSCVRTH